MKIASGTATLNVGIQSVEDLNKVSQALAKTGHNFWIKSKDNQVALRGKNIDTEKIVSELKKLGLAASLQKIDVDGDGVAQHQQQQQQKTKIHTTELRFEELCCKENAEVIKSKLELLKGVGDVSVDAKLKKVTVKGKLDEASVLEAALAIGKAKLWPANKAITAHAESPSQSIEAASQQQHQLNTVIVFPEGDYVFSDKNPNACSIM